MLIGPLEFIRFKIAWLDFSSLLYMVVQNLPDRIISGLLCNDFSMAGKNNIFNCKFRKKLFEAFF